MNVAESGGSRYAHVSFQHGRIGLPQINHNQAIQHVGELAVDVEAEQPSSNFGVLAQEDREALAISFYVGDWPRKFFQIVQGTAHAATIPAVQDSGAEGTPRLHKAGEIVVLHA